MVALAMGLQQPDVVRGLVLLSGYYYPSARLDAVAISPPAVPVIGDVMRYTVSPLISRLMWPGLTKKVFSPRRVDERFDRFPVWMALRPKQLRASAAESALMVPAAISLSRRYAELKVPVVILAGTQDKIVDCGHNSERLHERLPNSWLELAPGVGHMTHYAHPDKVMAAIDEIASQVGEPLHPRTPEAEALARASESGV
jgi:pimeloyl-ACP methyl ester carboxylesterase